MKTNSPILKPLDSCDLQIKFKQMFDRVEVAINSLSANHKNIPELTVLGDVANELYELECRYQGLEDQQVSESKKLEAAQ